MWLVQTLCFSSLLKVDHVYLLNILLSGSKNISQDKKNLLNIKAIFDQTFTSLDN